MGKNSVTSASKKSSTRLLGIAAILVIAGSAALWQVRSHRASSARGRERQRVVTGIVTTTHDSHRAQSSLATDGTERALPSDPALADALSHTSRLPYALRLKTVHSLQGSTLTADQAAFLRAFVAAPDIPEGLTIQQVRALKNDVLNVLCEQPGGEAATAAVLRALYADETADPGLRDYALQHLVTLTERDPSLGWSAHWLALDGKNTELAATALLHLSIHLLSQASPTSSFQVSSLSSQVSSADPQVSGLKSQVSADERQRIAAAALRLAADTTAKDPARTTALQVCGQLKLAEARPLAWDVARSDQAGIPFRIAAIATLGDLGGVAATQAYLQQLATGPEKRLRVPAESALKRFSIN